MTEIPPTPPGGHMVMITTKSTEHRQKNTMDRLDDNAISELARAARLERMASDLMVEAKELRAKYSTGRKPKQRTSMVQLAKSIPAR